MPELKSWFLLQQQAFLKALRVLLVKPYESLMVLLLMATPLILPLLFWSVLSHVNQLTHHWRQDNRILLYLEDNLQSAKQQSLLDTIKQLPTVANVVYKSPEQGLKELSTQEGMQSVLTDLVDNPLPAVVEVTPNASLDTDSTLNALQHTLQALPGVDVAKLEFESTAELFKVVSVWGMLSHGLMVLLLIVAILMMANTLRLSFYAKHTEITVLSLIGASKRFILRPFLYLGVLYGGLSALIALIVSYIFLLFADKALSNTFVLEGTRQDWLALRFVEMLSFLLIVSVLGWLTARVSIGRQLSKPC